MTQSFNSQFPQIQLWTKRQRKNRICARVDIQGVCSQLEYDLEVFSDLKITRLHSLSLIIPEQSFIVTVVSLMTIR